eukprot:9488844-Pyramimonas_sp.AAC.2
MPPERRQMVSRWPAAGRKNAKTHGGPNSVERSSRPHRFRLLPDQSPWPMSRSREHHDMTAQEGPPKRTSTHGSKVARGPPTTALSLQETHDGPAKPPRQTPNTPDGPKVLNTAMRPPDRPQDADDDTRKTTTTTGTDTTSRRGGARRTRGYFCFFKSGGTEPPEE